MVPKPLLLCVVGPTAIGKTALAIKIAEAFNTEIISADSRQFFKEMNIGTAVPSSEELQKIPHHFIRHKSIFESYSVGDFEREAIELLSSLFKKKHVVVMVGGSGLYVDAVVNGLDVFPEVDSKYRKQLTCELEKNGIEKLQNELKENDPEYFKTLDKNNPHRLIRALEICRASGKPYSSFLKKNSVIRDFDVFYIGLNAERKLVYDRINERVENLMAEGLLEEARQLYPNKDLNALKTVGYRELFEYFDGQLSLDEAKEEIKKNTRRFAKRQNTWFKKNTKINWFGFDTNPTEIIAFIKEKNAL